MIKKFDNSNQLFGIGAGHFWKDNIYHESYRLGRFGTGKSERVALYSGDWVVAVGIRAINRYMQVNNLQCEL